MRTLKYSINVTLDGCCDHTAIPADEELHRHAMKAIQEADALIFGRMTYRMMEEAWWPPGMAGMPDWTKPFARSQGGAWEVPLRGRHQSCTNAHGGGIDRPIRAHRPSADCRARADPLRGAVEGRRFEARWQARAHFGCGRIAIRAAAMTNASGA